MKIDRWLVLLTALLLLLTGCGDGNRDFMTGHWGGREDVPFGTAMEYGFYCAQEARSIPCVVSFDQGWNGPGAPDEKTAPEDTVLFTVTGYLDILEPHEGTTRQEVYESLAVFYMTCHEDTGAVDTAGGYLDENDGNAGEIDPQAAAQMIDLYYRYYDDYAASQSSTG